MRRFGLPLVPLAIVTVFALAACTATQTGSSPAGSATAPTPGASGGGGAGACATAAAGATAAVTVDYKGFKPSEDPVNAKVGDVIGWTNGDSAPHSATLDDGSCDTDSISQGATGLLVFNKAGTYTYHCKIHPGQMKDFKIVVSQ